MAQFNPLRKVLVGPGRLSFPSLFTPKPQTDASGQPTGKPKYEATILLPPTTNWQPIFAALDAARLDRWNNPQNFPDKVKDLAPFIRSTQSVNSLKGNPDTKDWFWISAKSEDPVGVINTQRQDVRDPKEVYAGRWVWLSISAFGFQMPRNLGLSWGLNGVMLGRHDKPFSARANAQEQFKDVGVDPSMSSDFNPEAIAPPSWGHVPQAPAFPQVPQQGQYGPPGMPTAPQPQQPVYLPQSPHAAGYPTAVPVPPAPPMRRPPNIEDVI